MTVIFEEGRKDPVKIQVRDLTRNELLLDRFVESDGRVSISVIVDGQDRVIVTVTPDDVSTYLRDLRRDRARVHTIHARFGLHNKMRI